MTAQLIAVGFPFAVAAGASVNALNLNDADNTGGTVFYTPKAGAIASVGVYVASLVGSPPAYNVGLVTVGADGYPTTTPAAGSAVASFTPTATGWQWVTLPVAGSVGKGSLVAVRVWPGTAAPDGLNFMAICTGVLSEGPFSVYSTTGFVPAAGATLMALRYSDGEVVGYALTDRAVGLTMTASTTPDEIGVKFSLPFEATLVGVLPRFNRAALGVAAQARLRLYAADGAVLDTLEITDKDYLDTADSLTLPIGAVAIRKGAVYRLTFAATVSANGAVPYYRLPFESAAAKRYAPWSSYFAFTSRTDEGAWADEELSLAPWVLLCETEFASDAGRGALAWVAVG